MRVSKSEWERKDQSFSNSKNVSPFYFYATQSELSWVEGNLNFDKMTILNHEVDEVDEVDDDQELILFIVFSGIYECMYVCYFFMLK
jgi:hypothetical protein